jgi:hypothetical protein
LTAGHGFFGQGQVKEEIRTCFLQASVWQKAVSLSIKKRHSMWYMLKWDLAWGQKRRQLNLKVVKQLVGEGHDLMRFRLLGGVEWKSNGVLNVAWRIDL